MIIFKCDKCDKTTNTIEKKHTGESVPDGWLSICGNDGFAIHNDLRDNKRSLRYIKTGNMNFCSKKCFITTFFEEGNEDE